MKNKRSAFTIVELLVVIVVIGILAAITIVGYTGVSKKAIAASQQSDLNNASKKLEMYKVDNSTYPQDMPETGNTSLYCPINPTDTKYCVKSSSGNKLTYSSTFPYTTYTLDATNNNNNSTNYRITNTSSPALYELATTTVPGAPTGLAVDSVGLFGITLSWTTPSNDGGSVITGYNLYRGLSSGSETLRINLSNINSYRDSSQSQLTLYYYKIKAVNSIGESEFSQEVSATSYGIAIPPD
ncbi:MAG: fibronectin type III domain-containing protein [Candidatus Saccharibacteria bacterium]